MKEAYEAMMNVPMRWTQWTPNGMIHCGCDRFEDVRGWIDDFEKEARKFAKNAGKPIVPYARLMRREDGVTTEVRFYSCTSVDEKEFEAICTVNSFDKFYFVRKEVTE